MISDSFLCSRRFGFIGQTTMLYCFTPKGHLLVYCYLSFPYPPNSPNRTPTSRHSDTHDFYITRYKITDEETKNFSRTSQTFDSR